MSFFSGIPFSELINIRKTDVMQTILNRAIKRGEIKAEKISERIARLPVDLNRHELLISYKPVTEEVIVEIVDDIFLPLIK